MKITKRHLYIIGFEILNTTLNLSIISFMWSISPFYCSLITGLFVAKYFYLNIYQRYQVLQLMKRYQNQPGILQPAQKEFPLHPQNNSFHNVPDRSMQTPPPCDNVTPIKGPIQ